MNIGRSVKSDLSHSGSPVDKSRFPQPEVMPYIVTASRRSASVQRIGPRWRILWQFAHTRAKSEIFVLTSAFSADRGRV